MNGSNSSRTNILVTGATGQLGYDLVRTLKPEYDVTGVSSSEFDVSELESTRKYVLRSDPDVIVHPAAYTDVDGCESNPKKAISVNGLGTRNVAISAREAGAKLFYVSTDYVFSGDKEGPYSDYDQPNPQTVYGQSKLLGEKYVIEQLNRFFIIRIAWLYGEYGGNFVKTMIKKCESGEDLKVVGDQFGSPTWTSDVARQVARLIDTKNYGTYNCTSGGSASWFEFTVEIFRQLGYELQGGEGVFDVVRPGKGSGKVQTKKICTLSKVSSEEFQRPADRPKNSVLKNELLKIQGLNVMPHWKDGLQNFLREYRGGVD